VYSETFTMQARFVVPSRSAGVLIGQGGNNIKELHDNSGARIQLHNRNGPDAGPIQDILKERIVTVQGTLAACIKAVELSLKKLVDEHSQENPAGSLKYQNMTTSYSRLMNNHFMASMVYPMAGGNMMQMPPNHMPNPMQQIYQNPGLYHSAYGQGPIQQRGGQAPMGRGFPQTSMATVTVTVSFAVALTPNPPDMVFSFSSSISFSFFFPRTKPNFKNSSPYPTTSSARSLGGEGSVSRRSSRSAVLAFRCRSATTTSPEPQTGP
jgi:hypothetical protein